MQELTRRLEACTAAGACCAEIRTCLRDAASSDDRNEALRVCAAFLGASRGVALYLLPTLDALPDNERVWHLELLDLALSDVSSGFRREHTHVPSAESAPEGSQQLEGAPDVAGSLNCPRSELLAAFLDVATRHLATLGQCAAPERRRWLRWNEQVLDVLFATQRKDEQLPQSGEGKTAGGRRWIVAIAASLLALHHQLLEQADTDKTRPDLQLMTLVWKNLTKMATSFGATLASASSSVLQADGTDDSAKEEDTRGRFCVEELLSAAVASLEDSAGYLLRLIIETPDVVDASTVKFFRLFWRAFQGQLLAFASVPTCELEDSVLALANVVATLLAILSSQHSLASPASKAGQELRRLLDLALTLAEKLGDSSDHGTLQEPTRCHVRALLWHPVDDVLRAVRQRQPVGVNSDDVESAIRWSHLLLLTAFTAADAPHVSAVPTGGEDNASDVDLDADEALERVVYRLLKRYRACARPASLGQSANAMKLFVELFLGLLVSFERVPRLQLFLLQQTLHPAWTQRSLCWELWRELLAHCWDESLASQALELLLTVALWQDDDNDAYVLAQGVDEEICELVAAVYVDLPANLKSMCVAHVTEVVQTVCSEGPTHHFTLRVASQLLLLEKLAACGFLKHSDGREKEAWIAKYLPMSFECCGTVLELLAGDASAPNTEKRGMIRVLDTCLLVLKAVFDDNEDRETDVAELSRILLPLATEALKQLAQQQCIASSASCGREVSNSVLRLERAATRSVTRATETCLWLLNKLGPLVKRNRSNQCVQVLKHVLMVAETARQPQRQREADGVLVVVAWFLKTTLFDIQVAVADASVVWQLLAALFRQLCASNTGSGRRTLLLSTTLDALYQLLAHSNVAEVNGASVRSLLSDASKRLLVEVVATRRMEREQIVEATDKTRAAVSSCLERQQAAQRRTFQLRFPGEGGELDASEEHSKGQKSEYDSPSHVETANKRPAEDATATAAPTKQRKLDHFVALCRELQASFASVDGESDAAANLLAGEELERATAALHQLLAKTATL